MRETKTFALFVLLCVPCVGLAGIEGAQRDAVLGSIREAWDRRLALREKIQYSFSGEYGIPQSQLEEWGRTNTRRPPERPYQFQGDYRAANGRSLTRRTHSYLDGSSPNKEWQIYADGETVTEHVVGQSMARREPRADFRARDLGFSEERFVDLNLGSAGPFSDWLKERPCARTSPACTLDIEEAINDANHPCWVLTHRWEVFRPAEGDGETTRTVQFRYSFWFDRTLGLLPCHAESERVDPQYDQTPLVYRIHYQISELRPGVFVLAGYDQERPGIRELHMKARQELWDRGEKTEPPKALFKARLSDIRLGDDVREPTFHLPQGVVIQDEPSMRFWKIGGRS